MALGWEEFSLIELSELRAGSAFKTVFQGKDAGDLPFIKVSDMNASTNEFAIRSANNWVSWGDARRMKAKPFPSGAVVFAKIGEALKHNRVRRLVRETLIDNNMMSATAREKIISPRFLFYLLSNFDIASMANGTALPYLTVSVLGAVRFLIPSKTEQERIAWALSVYDDLIENNTRRIAILEEMARRIFEEWFVHFRAPGCEGLPLVDSAIGPIPQGWQIKPIGEVFEVTGGGTPSKAEPTYWENGTINWFTPSDLTSSRSHFLDTSGFQITNLGLQKSSARMFAPYSVMMTSRATLGVFAINTTPAATNQGFITCLPNAEAPLYFLYFWLRQHAAEFERHASGATFKEITKGTFKKLPIDLPPAMLRRAFNETVNSMMGLALNLERQIRNLRAQRDLLLPKLISGEIDISAVSASMEEAAE